MSLKSTKTLLNIFKPEGILESDTETVDITDKISMLKRDLAARDLLLLNNNVNRTRSSIRRKILQQQLNELKKGGSRKKYKSKTKKKSST